jgi:TolA-binding protein
MSSKCNYWLGESHFGLNQYDKAISYFDKVLKSGSASKKDDAMIMIAEAQVRSGKINEAKKMFNSFITVYPQSQFVPRAKKMLQQL